MDSRPAATRPAPERSAPSRLRRWAVAALGCGFVGLGAVGIVVPGLPTTCFLLLASFCFASSSPRLHRWLMSHPRLGPYLEMARQRRMPLRAKVISLLLMWVGITWASLAVDGHGWVIQAILVSAGLIGSGVVTFGLRTGAPKALPAKPSA